MRQCVCRIDINTWSMTFKVRTVFAAHRVHVPHHWKEFWPEQMSFLFSITSFCFLTVNIMSTNHLNFLWTVYVCLTNHTQAQQWCIYEVNYSNRVLKQKLITFNVTLAGCLSLLCFCIFQEWLNDKPNRFNEIWSWQKSIFSKYVHRMMTIGHKHFIGMVLLVIGSLISINCASTMSE